MLIVEYHGHLIRFLTGLLNAIDFLVAPKKVFAAQQLLIQKELEFLNRFEPDIHAFDAIGQPTPLTDERCKEHLNECVACRWCHNWKVYSQALTLTATNHLKESLNHEIRSRSCGTMPVSIVIGGTPEEQAVFVARMDVRPAGFREAN